MVTAASRPRPPLHREQLVTPSGNESKTKSKTDELTTLRTLTVFLCL